MLMNTKPDTWETNMMCSSCSNSSATHTLEKKEKVEKRKKKKKTRKRRKLNHWKHKVYRRKLEAKMLCSKVIIMIYREMQNKQSIIHFHKYRHWQIKKIKNYTYIFSFFFFCKSCCIEPIIKDSISRKYSLSIISIYFMEDYEFL